MRTVGAKIFECDVPMQAVILSGGIHPAIESRVSELGTSWSFSCSCRHLGLIYPHWRVAEGCRVRD